MATAETFLSPTRLMLALLKRVQGVKFGYNHAILCNCWECCTTSSNARRLHQGGGRVVTRAAKD